MSGLSGLRAVSSTPVTREVLHEMAATQRHRGPGDVSVWVGADVGLAWSGPRGGSPGSCSQPALSADGRWVVVLDGRIVDQETLRSHLDLPSRGRDAEGSEAAALVAAGLAHEGISFVERLRGRFAIAAHDLRTHTTHLVRDRVGVQPLHYRHVPGGIAFASEVKTLLAVGPAPRVDHRSLDAYLAFRAVPAPDTLFEGVKKVRPGHRVMVLPGGRVEEAAWWVPPQADPAGTWSDGDAIEAVGDGVREAVRSALPAEGPVGIHLVGGLAPGLLAAHAREMGGDGRLHTFSVIGVAADDAVRAGRVAGLLGARHHEVRLPSLELVDLWSDLTWHRDAPLSSPADVAVHALSRVAREHVPSLLSPHGADELFGGHHRYRLARLAERTSVLPGRLRTGLDRRVERRLGTTFDAAERRRLLGQPPARERRTTAILGADAVDRMLRHDLGHALPDDVLERLDRMTAAASLEARLPFLDDDLVELALRLPTSVKVRSGCPSWVLREAARPMLPDEVVEHSGRAATHEWYAGARDAVRDRLTGADTWVAQTLDRAMIGDLLHRHEHGARNGDAGAERLWTLLALEVWHERFFGPGPRIPSPRGGAQPVTVGPQLGPAPHLV